MVVGDHTQHLQRGGQRQREHELNPPVAEKKQNAMNAPKFAMKPTAGWMIRLRNTYSPPERGYAPLREMRTLRG